MLCSDGTLFLPQAENLFWIGVLLMFLVAVFGIVAIVLLRICGKRLRRHLEEEYGKKRH